MPEIDLSEIAKKRDRDALLTMVKTTFVKIMSHEIAVGNSGKTLTVDPVTYLIAKGQFEDAEWLSKNLTGAFSASQKVHNAVFANYSALGHLLRNDIKQALAYFKKIEYPKIKAECEERIMDIVRLNGLITKENVLVIAENAWSNQHYLLLNECYRLFPALISTLPINPPDIANDTERYKQFILHTLSVIDNPVFRATIFFKIKDISKGNIFRGSSLLKTASKINQHMRANKLSYLHAFAHEAPSPYIFWKIIEKRDRKGLKRMLTSRHSKNLFTKNLVDSSSKMPSIGPIPLLMFQREFASVRWLINNMQGLYGLPAGYVTDQITLGYILDGSMGQSLASIEDVACELEPIINAVVVHPDLHVIERILNLKNKSYIRYLAQGAARKDKKELCLRCIASLYELCSNEESAEFVTAIVKQAYENGHLDLGKQILLLCKPGDIVEEISQFIGSPSSQNIQELAQIAIDAMKKGTSDYGLFNRCFKQLPSLRDKLVSHLNAFEYIDNLDVFEEQLIMNLAFINGSYRAEVFKHVEKIIGGNRIKEFENLFVNDDILQQATELNRLMCGDNTESCQDFQPATSTSNPFATPPEPSDKFSSKLAQFGVLRSTAQLGFDKNILKRNYPDVEWYYGKIDTFWTQAVISEKAKLEKLTEKMRLDGFDATCQQLNADFIRIHVTINTNQPAPSLRIT